MSKIAAIVIDVQGDDALLYMGDDEALKVKIPASWLPEGATKDTALTVSFEIDQPATDRMNAKLDKMMKRLEKNGDG